MSGADYQVEVRVRNGRILKLMRDHGFESVSHLCRAAGISDHAGIGNIINLRRSPMTEDGRWRAQVLAIAAALATTPDDLFSPAQREMILKTNKAVLQASEEEVEILLSHRRMEAISPETSAALSERRRAITAALDTLPPRPREVIIRRMGLDGGEPETMETIAQSLGVSRGRIQQLEARAIHILRRSSQSRKLADYLDIEVEP